MSGVVRHLTTEAVLAIHAEVLVAHGGATGLGSKALLESAVAAPQATMAGRAVFSDPVEIAAAYLYYLCQNHPFADGNKRTALAACLIFLDENDLLGDESLDTDLWESLVMDVASSQIDREQTARRLKQLLPS